MKKVIIIGSPGSGKSTFARKLEAITGLPLFYLDMLYWNEDKTTVSKEVFLERLQSIMENEKWIIDGNYASTMEMRIKACDSVFFLDYPTDICLKGIEERKGKPRPDMPWLEAENQDDEFINFIKNYSLEQRPKVMKLLEKYSEKNVIIFCSREESEKFLETIKRRK